MFGLVLVLRGVQHAVLQPIALAALLTSSDATRCGAIRTGLPRACSSAVRATDRLPLLVRPLVHADR